MKSIPIALTMGDPSGIGPEVAVSSFTQMRNKHPMIVIGDSGVIKRAVDMVAPEFQVRIIRNPGEARYQPKTLEVLHVSGLKALPSFGEVSAASGSAAFEAIHTGVSLANAGSVAGLVTAPLHKEALSAAGIHYPGHTEILADLAKTGKVAMMLANDEIKTVLVTIHCSLKKAIELGDYEAQLRTIRLAHLGGKALGISAPRIAVAGLNPHAGEGGLFGDEEIRIILPAIKAAQREGMDVSGPWPGDTVFMQARTGVFDIVVAQYHDQGLIPVKYMGLEKGVNITLGLPFVRTSPDHGTAFDIAGKGIADASSMTTAIEYALRILTSKKRSTESWEYDSFLC